MDPTNTNPNTSNNRRPNSAAEIDRWLDAALGQYAKAEPRAGLETRVLATLCAEQTLTARKARWWWALATAVAFAAIVVGIWLGQDSPQHATATMAAISRAPSQEIQKQNTQATEKPATLAMVSTVRRTQTVSGARAKQSLAKACVDEPLPTLASTSAPKLEQFPSPQPLSEQEQLLMSYVAHYPETAALVAQAQTEQVRQELEEEAAQAANGGGQ